MHQYGVVVLDPDELLADAFNEQPSALLRVLRAQAAAWGGGRPLEDLLDALERAGAPMLARQARDALAA